MQRLDGSEGSVELPFSHDAFLDVFAAYNTALWPLAAALWVATAVFAGRFIRRGGMEGRGLFALLAVHWACSGILYHWFFFRSINPAAALFGALFVIQALLFVWLAIASRGQFALGIGPRGFIGGALVLYGLAYPLVGLGFGLQYPRVPLFGVPCPTTLVTAGLLLTATGVPRFVSVVPVLWAAIGSSAAFALGIRADLALVVAAVALALDMLMPSVLGRKASKPSTN